MNHLEELRASLDGQFECRIFFVDDGSTDDTSAEIMRRRGSLSVQVLKHEGNRGPGAAFGTGFAQLHSLLNETDWIVTMEGDNTSRIHTLRQMLIRRLEGFDVVLASPYAYGGGISHTSLMRILLSHVANTLIKELLGIRGILTMSSFFRLYHAPIVKRLQNRYGPMILETNGFESMVELLAKLIRVQATISEVAMPLDGSHRLGKSKMKIFRTIWGYLRLFASSRSWR